MFLTGVKGYNIIIKVSQTYELYLDFPKTLCEKKINSRLISSYEDKIVKRHAGGDIGKPFREFYKRIDMTFAEFITALVVISRKKCREGTELFSL